MIPDVALAATLHDPPGALLGLTRRLLPKLTALYRGVAVATSPPTSRAVVRELRRAGAWAGEPTADLRGPVYRLSLRAALAQRTAFVHYLDFDRALHWLLRTPGEYRAALRAASRFTVLLIGRTPKAHRSHQLPLYATEAVVNRLLAERLRLLGRLDFLAPSFVIERARARELLRRSRARDAQMYGEWAAVLSALAPEMGYLECRGLDWETPDRQRALARRVGLPAYRRRFDTPVEWALRTSLAHDIVAGCERAVTRWPAAHPVIHRLRPRVG